eukprot:TRINITY_DN1865_c0_g1_i2.p1 TRINITY_DN1865_c0_g1~~TRINITY_DN1865_c0_g1_i2.p1  ORF type:complete len:533 (-),score=145.42 TRINITY_DN1865_c0_g1_i2:837-2435(-)
MGEGLVIPICVVVLFCPTKLFPQKISSKRKHPDDNDDDNDQSRSKDMKPRGLHVNPNIHPRNPYRSTPSDFLEIAKKCQWFQEFVRIHPNGSALIDYTDPQAVIAVTKVLLQHDFGIDIVLPSDQLCPTVTSRLNYILWLQDLLGVEQNRVFQLGSEFDQVPDSLITGVDIGTGASCIYPLLGTRVSKWKFIATELDATSVEYAVANVARNNLEQFITVRQVERSDQFLCGVVDQEDDPTQYDFCMCNPPFFESTDDKLERNDRVCVATDGELATEGGEVAFINGIIQDSLKLKERFKWYSSMVGIKANLTALRRLLLRHKSELACVVETAFHQGKTTRWALAWSFTHQSDPEKHKVLHPQYHLLKAQSSAAKNPKKLKLGKPVVPLPTDFTTPSLPFDSATVFELVSQCVSSLDGSCASFVFGDILAPGQEDVNRVVVSSAKDYTITGTISLELSAQSLAFHETFTSSSSSSSSSTSTPKHRVKFVVNVYSLSGSKYQIRCSASKPTIESWFLGFSRLLKMILLETLSAFE